MSQNDDKLDALLKQWRGIEPKGSFEANVWRQIRTADGKRSKPTSLIEVMGRLLLQPAWSVCAALAVALLLGVWGGIASASRATGTSQAELQFLAPGTLAGSYVGTKELR
jgi:hypothetical protein